MSTSTSTAPSSALGECVVCGKESSTRCSSCAKGGVGWMYFCSREHQKLIWSAHKRVCGGSFKWPALQIEERDRFFELSSRPFRGPDGMTTWLQQLKENVFDQAVNPRSRSAVGGEARLFEIMTKRIQEAGDLSGDQVLIHEYRATAFSIKISSEPFLEHLTYSDYLNLTQRDPLGFFAYSQRSWFKQLQERHQAPWYSELQHRLLVLVGLLVSCKKAAEKHDELGVSEQTPLFIFALNKVCMFTRGSVAEVDSQIAIANLEVYLPSVFEELGVGLTPKDSQTQAPWYHSSNVLAGSVVVQGAVGGDYKLNSD